MPTPQDIKRRIVARAKADTAALPEYRGYWDGPEWILVTFRRRVMTRTGVAFEAGDVTIAKADPCGHPIWITAYSFRARTYVGVPRASVVAD